MGRHIEPLNGGLNTSTDTAQLKKGQLTDMRNLVYKNGSSSLVRPEGRVPFGTVTASAVDVYGVRDVNYDNGDHFLIAAFDDQLRYASVSGTIAAQAFLTPRFIPFQVTLTASAGQLSAQAPSNHGILTGDFLVGSGYVAGNYVTSTATNSIGLASAVTGYTTSTAVSIDIQRPYVWTSGSSLESAQYRNRYFLFNGATATGDYYTSNQVMYLSATAGGQVPLLRTMGLYPVNAKPYVVTAVGFFGIPTTSLTGYYEYWTTEVLKYQQDSLEASASYIESAYTNANGVPTVYVSAINSVGVMPVISRPPAVNPRATHWRVYRSTKKTYDTDKAFPNGFMIAELPISQATFNDTSTAGASASAFPANVQGAYTGHYPWLSGWVSATAASADDGVYASSVASASTPLLSVRNAQVFGFNIPAFNTQIRGIAVEVQAYVSSGYSTTYPITPLVSLGYFPGERTGLKEFSQSGPTLTSTNAAAPQTFTVGGPLDTWNPPDKPGFSADEFTSNKFQVSVAFERLPLFGNYSVGIDYVKLFWYTGASVSTTIQYPAVVYTFGDISAAVSKRFPPPPSSTGDLYQDSLVVNDKTNKSLVRWSFPDEPESFPPAYFYDFETKANDEVTCIKTVNNRLVIGMKTALFRMNYLPSERDASFDKGKAVEIISNSFGIVNPMCACTFTIDGLNEQLAFISSKGLHSTDGFNFVTRSKNLDWRKYIPDSTTAGECIALVNDPENRSLRFYFKNSSSTAGYGDETYLCLHASYDRPDISPEGDFKFSGPVHVRNYEANTDSFANPRSVWALQADSGKTEFFIGYGGATAAGAGKVYREAGYSLPSKDTSMWFKTRRMYLGGFTGEWQVDDLYLYSGSGYGNTQVTASMYNLKTNASATQTYEKPFYMVRGQEALGNNPVLYRISPKFMAEGMETKFTFGSPATTPYSFEYLIFGSKDLGLEDSGL